LIIVLLAIPILIQAGIISKPGQGPEIRLRF
jgi:hypothetical protein